MLEVVFNKVYFLISVCYFSWTNTEVFLIMAVILHINPAT